MVDMNAGKLSDQIVDWIADAVRNSGLKGTAVGLS